MMQRHDGATGIDNFTPWVVLSVERHMLQMVPRWFDVGEKNEI